MQNKIKGKIFNAQEVQAMLAGNKTQFRQITPFQPTNELAIDSLLRLYKPYEIGQKIFCKESFWQFGCYDGGYDSDESRFIGSNKITFCPEEAAKPQTLCKSWKKRPAQHMKQEHSRLTLRIKSVKVERLADISEEDCLKEGVWKEENGIGRTWDIKNAFAAYWNSTHKKPEEKWEANPWVFVYEYEIINLK